MFHLPIVRALRSLLPFFWLFFNGFGIQGYWALLFSFYFSWGSYKFKFKIRCFTETLSWPHCICKKLKGYKKVQTPELLLHSPVRTEQEDASGYTHGSLKATDWTGWDTPHEGHHWPASQATGSPGTWSTRAQMVQNKACLYGPQIPISSCHCDIVLSILCINNVQTALFIDWFKIHTTRSFSLQCQE